MIIEKSDIKYIHFGVIDLNYQCRVPKKDEAPSFDLDVDLNYEILKVEGPKNIFQLILEMKLSPRNNLPGYNISLKPFGIFELPAGDDKKLIDSALLYTCIPMILGNARGFIADITSYFPLGKYFLPSLSMASIIAANKNKSNSTLEIKQGS
jgi:preprotein translocase subunit SecB